MERVISFTIGATIGMLTAAIATYLFAPARDTHFDQRYQSRWDRALAEGREAAAEHEATLRRQLAQAKQSSPSLSDGTQTA